MQQVYVKNKKIILIYFEEKNIISNIQCLIKSKNIQPLLVFFCLKFSHYCFYCFDRLIKINFKNKKYYLIIFFFQGQKEQGLVFCPVWSRTNTRYG